MITGFGSRLGVICVMILIQSCSAWTNWPNIEKLQWALIENLETPNRVTWDTVKDASVEFASLSGENRNFYLGIGKMKLLYESVLLPFEKHSGGEEDEGEREKFVDDLFATYKWFWPYYVNQQFVQGDVYPTPVCDRLYGVVDGRIKNEMIIVEDFPRAEVELKRLLLRAGEIIENGDMPYKKPMIAKLFNAQVQHKAFLKARKEIKERNVTTVRPMRIIYKKHIEDEKEQMRNEETESDAN